jgi:hypothetical protein
VREDQIKDPTDLDAALVGSALQKRDKLWRAAEGRSFQWLLGAIVGALFLFGGFYRSLVEEQADAAVSIALGLILVGSAMYRRHQSQINALRELLKLQDRASVGR